MCEARLQSWALSVFFLFFSEIKNDFLHFYQVNLTGSGLLNRTGAEIDY